MRAPQIDLPLQPPAPAPQEAPARAGRDDGDDFASTLKRSSAQPAGDDRPQDPAAAKPERPGATAGRPATATAQKPSAATTDGTDKPAADGAGAIPASDTPADDQGLLDPALAALLAVPAAPVVAVADESAVPVSDALDPLAALTAPAAALPVATVPVATVAEMAVPEQTETLPPAAAAPPTAAANPALPAAPAPAPAPQAAIAALAVPVAGEAVATADVSDVASVVPMAQPGVPAPAAKAETVPAGVAATARPTTEVAASAALPPVTPVAEVVAKPVLPEQAAIVPTEDAPAPAPVLPGATPLSSATPAAQSASMHAVAAAIGDHEDKDAKAQETVTATARSVTGDLAAPAQPAQPATPTPAAKPMSETVLAQNTLAQQGNAMEKAVSHQVAKALVHQLPNGDRMMVVRLTPPELGTVKVEVVERQGVFSARLHAEDDGVRLALERFLPAMRQELRASDAPIRELNLSDQAQFQRSFADGQQGQHQQDANRPGSRRVRDDAPRFSIDGVRQEPVLAPRSAPLGGRVGLSGVDAHA